MSVQQNCIFCKIIAGDIPAAIVLDTREVLAFLDVAPLAEGHTLLVPKRHCSRLDEMAGEELGIVLHELPRLSKAILTVTHAEGFNVLQNNGRSAGQVVEHVHFHIIPRMVDDGLGYRWNAGSYASGRAEALQKSIQSALES